MLDESPIKTYKDFEGRRVGVQPEGEHYLQALAAVHGLQMSKIQVVRVGFDPTPLLTGQIDAYMAWIINQPYRLEKAGKKWRALLLADNPGLTFYAMLPFATDQMVKEQPEVIEGFLRASLRGWQAVLENPDEAARITVEKYCRAAIWTPRSGCSSTPTPSPSPTTPRSTAWAGWTSRSGNRGGTPCSGTSRSSERRRRPRWSISPF